MVCASGRPNLVTQHVIATLGTSRTGLLYHGDFDWPGLRIGNHVMREHGARAWRFGAADYRDALHGAPTSGRSLEERVGVEASWDDTLASAMRAARRAIDEEMVADRLIDDLATAQ